jgi:hypothetical protein
MAGMGWEGRGCAVNRDFSPLYVYLEVIVEGECGELCTWLAFMKREKATGFVG